MNEKVFEEFCSLNINNIECNNREIRLDYWEVEVNDDDEEIEVEELDENGELCTYTYNLHTTFSFDKWKDNKYIIRRNEDFEGVAEIEIRDEKNNIVTDGSYSFEYEGSLTIFINWISVNKEVAEILAEEWKQQMDKNYHRWAEEKEVEIPEEEINKLLEEDYNAMLYNLKEDNGMCMDWLNFVEDYFNDNYDWSEYPVEYEYDEFMKLVEKYKEI